MNQLENSRLVELEKENEELKKELKQKDEFLRHTFGRYLTDEVLDAILESPDHLMIKGERREVSIMFADLRQSTALSEKMEPGALINMLNHFFGDMIEIINAWQGNILEFLGDAIVTVFGAPRPNEYSARDAVACAVAMQRRMDIINAWNKQEGYPEISMGIGIHSGEAILGSIGSQTRMKYDMIGRNVNLASRIQGFTEGGQILISTQTLIAAGPKVVENKEGARWVKPKGIQKEILVHDIIGFGKHLTSFAKDKTLSS